MHDAINTALGNMFHLPVPWVEKIARPFLVYFTLVVFLRLFGKRELAQLNPFDLVVLLSISNTVQNAIIGDDNSVTGGILGAFALLTANWLLMNVLYRTPRLNAALQGSATVLIRNGNLDRDSLRQERLSDEELISVLNRNGFSHPREVEICVLEPNGTFYVKGKSPAPDEEQRTAVLEALQQLTREVQTLQRRLVQSAAQPQSDVTS